MGHAAGVIERERKYRVSDEDAARIAAFLRTNGKLVVREVQRNVIFRDRATRLRKGTYLRLREATGKRELTFKGKKSQQGLDRSRLELTVALGDGPLLELLDAIGLEPQLTYVKETEIWLIDGVHVSLDRLEGIGRFCELEAYDEEADLGAVAAALGLLKDAYEPRGYRTLAAEMLAPGKASG